MSGVHRVVVGASGSPGSLRALRYAEDVARAYNATLVPVLAWVPPGGDVADRLQPCSYLRRLWAADASQRLRDALNAAWGGLPADLRVEPLVVRGESGLVLVEVASCPGDLLVVGAGRRGLVARVFSGRVSRYCLAHAHCPVLAIPPPALARETGHGPFGWALWRRALSPERVLRDRGRAAA